MNPITNEQRAAWAAHAIAEYSAGKEGPGGLYDDPDAVLTDLLCDLMHHARSAQIDFEKCLRAAQMHYEAEGAEELESHFALRCPSCSKGEEIWCDRRGTICASCGHAGNINDFSNSGEPE